MDIFKLTRSKAREKILKLYFSDPTKRYYLRELERILEVPAGNIRRELLSLSKSGLFEREAEGNQIYYRLNKNSAYYNDLKNIIFKSIGIEGELKKVLNMISGIKQSFIFGSFAKNRENSSSDIDLMIVGWPNDDVLVREISKLERSFNREINYHVFDEKEWQEKSRKDSFLVSVNKGPKIKII